MLTLCMPGFLAFLKSAVFVVGYISNNNLFPEPLTSEEERIYIEKYENGDEEAREKSEELKNGSKFYPVHYSVSDTSGEKAFEEFVTHTETADYDRFNSLGVITGKEIPDKDRVKTLLAALNTVFEKKEVTKEEVVDIMQAYLPNFEHIETGKSLDSKM